MKRSMYKKHTSIYLLLSYSEYRANYCLQQREREKKRERARETDRSSIFPDQRVDTFALLSIGT